MYFHDGIVMSIWASFGFRDQYLKGRYLSESTIKFIHFCVDVSLIVRWMSSRRGNEIVLKIDDKQSSEVLFRVLVMICGLYYYSITRYFGLRCRVLSKHCVIRFSTISGESFRKVFYQI